ncbi:cytochrome P450 [Obba rivulosa]|uniref:Cytochrome P450 n=1 Tax=Obba rivulosa TaxID=1052685 RepID=A0A8E2DVA5_9APHY|nr:cytochrome P450 [Obba rivulosa]
MLDYVKIALALIAFYVFKTYLGYRRAIKSIHDHPGYRSFYYTANRLLRKRIPGVVTGDQTFHYYKYDDFERYGWDILSAVTVAPKVRAAFIVANTITESRTAFRKPVEKYDVLAFFGKNVVITEGEEWKRQRRITTPLFSERNNRFVWEETVRIMEELFDSWGDKKRIVLDDAIDLCISIALHVIAAAGFGHRFSWDTEAVVPPGHQVPFKDALHIVSRDLFFKLMFPEWFLKWAPIKKIRVFSTAFADFQKYMIEMIEDRKREGIEGRSDLFSNLVGAATGDEDGSNKLTFDEVTGNIFIFLFAGWTTAYTLAFALALLALYPDEQEQLYQHIRAALPTGGNPVMFYETLRLFPPVAGLPKVCEADTVLQASNPAGDKLPVFIRKGTRVWISTAALHYHPQHWEDPHAFKPSRFLGNWPREAFMPFSGGLRACLGRRFSELEGIVVLTMLISRYKVEIKEESRFFGETFEQRKKRILSATSFITLTPDRIPLQFVRRS